MYLFNVRLFSSIILVILCFDFSAEEFGDWFNDNNDQNSDKYEESTKNLTSSEPFVLTSPTTTSSTSAPTSQSTPSSTTPSTTTSTRTPLTSRPTTPSTSHSTVRTTRNIVQKISSSTSTLLSTEEPPKSSSEKAIECLKIELNAKVIFKYTTNEGFGQQFEIIGGNTNGELIQPNKCLRDQTLIIKYDLVDKTQLTLGISITDTDFSIKRIHFEYPFHRLPDDFNKDNHSEEVQTCSADKANVRLSDNCLIAQNNHLTDYSFEYKINEQISCKKLPTIVLKNNKTSIDILIKDFRFVVTDSQLNAILTQRSDDYCPINSNNIDNNDVDAMFGGTTKIWVGVSYAIVGALIMFGFAFLYEKFVRERLLYNPIDRQEPEI